MSDLNVRREEYKYFISGCDVHILRAMLNKIMRHDAGFRFVSTKSQHAINDYKVTSLYFDTPTDNDLDEKLDGLLDRKKYRIRIYNSEKKTIKLEIKKRNGTVIQKESIQIDEDIAANIINRDYDSIRDSNDLLNRVITNFKANGYLSRVIVEYDREAYFLPYGNIRITIDKNLRTYNHNHSLFYLNDVASTSVFFDDIQVVEVKFSVPLPDHIKSILSAVPLTRCSISKYVLCQRFSDHFQWRDHLISPF